MYRVRYEIRYEALVHGVQNARVVPVGHEQHVFEVSQAEHVDALKSCVPAVRIVYVFFFGPFLHAVRQRLQVRVARQYLLETDAGRTDRQIRLFQIRKRVDVGIVHRRAQERHQRALREQRTQYIVFMRVRVNVIFNVGRNVFQSRYAS